MRLIISLWFITFCVALLITEQQASFSPKSEVFLVKNNNPEKILFLDQSDESQTPTSDCDSNDVPLKIPNISDNLPEPIENYEFDWAGFNRAPDDYDEKFEKLKKKRTSTSKYHVTGDFDKGYLKHVHLYPPSCACQTKVSPCPLYFWSFL